MLRGKQIAADAPVGSVQSKPAGQSAPTLQRSRHMNEPPSTERHDPRAPRRSNAQSVSLEQRREQMLFPDVPIEKHPSDVAEQSALEKHGSYGSSAPSGLQPNISAAAATKPRTIDRCFMSFPSAYAPSRAAGECGADRGPSLSRVPYAWRQPRLPHAGR